MIEARLASSFNTSFRFMTFPFASWSAGRKRGVLDARLDSPNDGVHRVTAFAHDEEVFFVSQMAHAPDLLTVGVVDSNLGANIALEVDGNDAHVPPL